MKTVGQVLAEARATKKITLTEAERSTKIRVDILRALEADDFSRLPSSTYIRGFIKNYGSFLDLDSDQLLAIFRRQYDVGRGPAFAILPDLSSKETPKLTLTPGRAFGLGISVLVLGFLGYLLAQYQSYAAAPMLSITAPSENLRVNNGAVQVVGRTDRDATLKINGQEIALTESGAFSVSVTLPDGTSDLTFSAVNKLGRVTTLKRTVTVEASVAKDTNSSFGTGGPVATGSAVARPTVAAATTANSYLEVTLQIGPNAAWIEITADSVSLSKLFAAGASQTFKAQDKIIVKTFNAGSTEVIVNGVNQGKMGEESQIATKTFTR
jgi:cytoskeletal protein RodZ